MFALIMIVFILSFLSLYVGLPLYFDMRRDRRIRQALGENVQIETYFPIASQHERIIRAALDEVPQSLSYMVVGDDWLFAKPNSHYRQPFSDDGLVVNTITVCAFHLQAYAPDMYVRHKSLRNIVMRPIQQKLKDGRLVRCEGVFEATQELYANPSVTLDVLSILSPEVLDTLRSPPYVADIYIKRDQLYYLFTTGDEADKVMPVIMQHVQLVKRELEDNLHRWARTDANQRLRDSIRATPIAYTLREQAERSDLL